ncbi:hypothetical protein GX50_03898 [[Emmonsia] crescens]|uniref:Uncharacterized protein n=1 Tax=[Emmonsia] crescens TaxID=73230 RepID=A0A2B7ZH31_9EURO|nr:hypothetical protein GX50_03898 [Emmonsia crescens]
MPSFAIETPLETHARIPFNHFQSEQGFLAIILTSLNWDSDTRCSIGVNRATQPSVKHQHEEAGDAKYELDIPCWCLDTSNL